MNARLRFLSAVVAVVLLMLSLGVRPQIALGAGPVSGLDPGFGNGGRVILDFGAYNNATLALQPDGKILVGSRQHENQFSYLLARLNSNGSLDSTFATGGIFTTTMMLPADDGSALLLQADGKILLGGSANGSYALLRLNADGSLDSGFGQDGLVVTTSNEGGASLLSLAMQSDGKIVAAGLDENTFGLARYNGDGSLDVSFGVSGTLTTTITAPGVAFPGVSSAHHVFVLPDAKILAVGNMAYYAGPAPLELLVMTRYTADGALDTTFGNSGMVVGHGPNGKAATLDSAGRIVVGGSMVIFANITSSAVTAFFALRRYEPDGAVDATFGSDEGSTGLANVVTRNAPIASSIAVQPDGKIIATDGVPNVGRYNTDGSLDTTFGSGGWQTAGYNADVQSSALALQSDGKILVAGPIVVSGQYHIAIARFKATNPCAVSFSDVASGDYFAPALDRLTCLGAVSGYADGTFRPTNVVTRGQLVKMVVAGQQRNLAFNGPPAFSDVNFEHDFNYLLYIETARRAAIISGYTDGTFRPNNPVTRGQLSKIVVRAMGWTTDTVGGPHFTDVQPDNPFYSAIETASKHGVISGYDDGTFRWELSATRAQVSKVLGLALAAPTTKPGK